MNEIRKNWVMRGLCRNCGTRPPLEKRSLCEICLRTQRENARKHRAANPDEFRKEYHDRKNAGICTKCGKVSPREGYSTCSLCSAAARQQAVRIKKMVMDMYGGQCVCCGETHIAFLTIDHKNNDGRTRREEGVGGSLYQKLRTAPIDPSLQVMCYNCNCGRRATGDCPHKNDTHYTEALSRERHAHTQHQWEMHGQLALPFWSVQFERKRTRLEIQVEAERALALITATPGQRTECIRRQMGLDHKPWNYLLGYLRKAQRIVLEGRGRGVTIRPLP